MALTESIEYDKIEVVGQYKHVNGSNNLAAINATSNYSNSWTMGTATYYTA